MMKTIELEDTQIEEMVDFLNFIKNTIKHMPEDRSKANFLKMYNNIKPTHLTLIQAAME